MEASDALQRSVDQFRARLEAVDASQWQSSTPCSEWDVRALVNHITGELRWIPPMLDGKTIADVGDSLNGDLLGDDPQSAWISAAQAAVHAASQPGAGERTVHLSYGDRPADDYVREVASDIVIHTWDLARGVGADDRLDANLVELAGTALRPQLEMARAAGYFGPAVDAPPDADAQTQLLAATGRRS